MRSSTRSGRLYKIIDEANERGGQHPAKVVNVVTPQKNTTQFQKSDLTEITDKRFEDVVELEPNTAGSSAQFFSVDQQLFKYSVSDGSDSEDDMEEKPILSRSKITFSETEMPITQIRQNLECTSTNAPSYDQKLSQRATVPIHPLVPRNHYGGVRDCLPPIQLTRVLTAQPSPAEDSFSVERFEQGKYCAEPVRTDFRPATGGEQAHVLTAAQLLRAESNKQAAIAKRTTNAVNLKIQTADHK